MAEHDLGPCDCCGGGGGGVPCLRCDGGLAPAAVQVVTSGLGACGNAPCAPCGNFDGTWIMPFKASTDLPRGYTGFGSTWEVCAHYQLDGALAGDCTIGHARAWILQNSVQVTYVDFVFHLNNGEGSNDLPSSTTNSRFEYRKITTAAPIDCTLTQNLDIQIQSVPGCGSFPCTPNQAVWTPL